MRSARQPFSNSGETSAAQQANGADTLGPLVRPGACGSFATFGGQVHNFVARGDRLDVRRFAAILHAVVTSLVVAFQLALAIGVPWGEYAMGGAFPGQLPPVLRAAAIAQALLLLALTAVVLARQRVALARLAHPAGWLIWVVVAFAALSLVLNLLTPSAGERAIWSPVALVLFLASLLVATGPDVPNLHGRVAVDRQQS